MFYKVLNFPMKIIFLLIVILLYGCGGQSNNKTIGMVISTLENPFFVKMKYGANETAREGGYKLIVLDSHNDPMKELSNVEDLVTRDVSVIIINPTDSAAVSNAVKYANDHDVDIITLDRTANKGKVLAHIESNNVEGGKMAAEFLVERLSDQGSIIELQGVPGTSASIERGTGFNNVMKKENIKVVAKQPAYFDRTKGLNVTENLLQAHPNIVGIFAENDEMALGAARAVHEANKKNILIVGFDGTKDAINAIRNGQITATVAQQPYLMGQLGVEAAIKVLKKQDINSHIIVPLRLITSSNV